MALTKEETQAFANLIRAASVPGSLSLVELRGAKAGDRAVMICIMHAKPSQVVGSRIVEFTRLPLAELLTPEEGAEVMAEYQPTGEPGSTITTVQAPQEAVTQPPKRLILPSDN
jgi:hypothetical protein